ncbi:hypothetical protein PIB30_089422, partial [Stylosanthes scabra]|nr:hypothetical protein [Stylosanthes scabra]
MVLAEERGTKAASMAFLEQGPNFETVKKMRFEVSATERERDEEGGFEVSTTERERDEEGGFHGDGRCWKSRTMEDGVNGGGGSV